MRAAVARAVRVMAYEGDRLGVSSFRRWDRPGLGLAFAFATDKSGIGISLVYVFYGDDRCSRSRGRRRARGVTTVCGCIRTGVKYIGEAESV